MTTSTAAQPEGRDDCSPSPTTSALHISLRDIDQRPGFLSATDLLQFDRGGDVDLTVMPADVVERCRNAWARLFEYPRVIVHGDPGVSNILVSATGVVLIDWDECRVDVPLFDLAALPRDVVGLRDEEWWIATQAASAWEVAVSWRAEPEYARRCLAELEA